MPNTKILWVILFCALGGCVQKTYPKTVVFYVDVSGVKNIETVGIRGKEKPLSWDQDIEMTPIVPDSLYTVTLTGQTPYTFTEVKFTVNKEFELKDKENRRVNFSKGDTTVYRAVFDKN